MPRPLNPPPPYQHTLNQRGNNPTAYTDAPSRENNENDNLLSSQHSSYSSAPTPPKANTIPSPSSRFFLIIVIILIIAAIFYPTTQQARREWEAEEREHQALRDAWNSERRAMVMEREQWRKERAEHENRQRREEEEKRALIVWENLTPSKRCLRYGTREYSATLAHVPLGLDPLKECWKKSIDIHGRQILPSRCDTQGMCGAVTGHWIVDFKEATCVTWWDGYYDKGCVERGIHRYESGLVNLQSGDTWQEMCATTPGHVQGKDFNGPTSCATWWPSGVHGIWLIEDANCL